MASLRDLVFGCICFLLLDIFGFHTGGCCMDNQDSAPKESALKQPALPGVCAGLAANVAHTGP